MSVTMNENEMPNKKKHVERAAGKDDATRVVCMQINVLTLENEKTTVEGLVKKAETKVGTKADRELGTLATELDNGVTIKIEGARGIEDKATDR